MSSFLIVSSCDLRRNTSSNIRTIAFMKALKVAGNSVSAMFIPSNRDKDQILSIELESICDNMFMLIEKKEEPEVQIATEEKKGNNNIKSKLLKLYSKIFVYDVYQINFHKIKYKSFKNDKCKFDYVVSSSEPRSSHKLARILLRKKIVLGKWIQYWGDPMTNDVASQKIFSSLEKKEERRLLKQAYLILYTNPGCVEYMKNKYKSCEEKMSWIPTTDFVALDNNIDNEYLITYIGDYVSKFRNIIPYYEACCLLKEKTYIAGGGDIILSSKNNVIIDGRVSREMAIEIENKSFILAVIDNRNDGNCIQVPGKLYHYALTNKYVLIISDSNKLENYYSKYNRFVFCDNNVDSIINAINRIKNGKLEKNYCSPLNEFKCENVAEKIQNILKER